MLLAILEIFFSELLGDVVEGHGERPSGEISLREAFGRDIDLVHSLHTVGIIWYSSLSVWTPRLIIKKENGEEGKKKREERKGGWIFLLLNVGPTHSEIIKVRSQETIL